MKSVQFVQYAAEEKRQQVQFHIYFIMYVKKKSYGEVRVEAYLYLVLILTLNG